MPDDASVKPTLPDKIGEYDILREIGSGGMATVYAALQKRPKRTVALKVVKAGGRSPVVLRRFRREVDILGRLNHPYIAQIFDAGTHDDGGGAMPYLVMEYVSGGRNILEYIAAKSLGLRDRLKLFVRVCAAVEHGHRHKIVHRDLKPGNILIDSGGEPKVIDFGVARALEVDVSAQTMATEAGHIVGTIQYMAPEQIDAQLHDISPRCDVYALGVLLFKLTTGQFPYDLRGLPVYVAAQAIREEMPKHPGTINSELAGDLETIILKALEKNPARRYRNAGSLGRDIVRYLASKPIQARRAALLYRLRLFASRHRALMAASGIVLVIAAAAITAITIGRSREAAREEEDAAAIARLTQTVEQREAALRELQQAGNGSPNASDPESEPQGFVLREQTGRIISLAFDSTGTLLASGSRDQTWALWNVDEQRLLKLADHREACPVNHVTFSGDGALLVTAGRAGAIVMIDTGTFDVVRELRQDCDETLCVAVDHRGATVAVGCNDLTLHLRDTLSEDTQLKRGTSGAFGSIAWSADETRVAAGSRRGTMYVWDVTSNAGATRFDGLEANVRGVGFDLEGETLVAVDDSGQAIAWAASTAEVIEGFAACRTPVRAMAFDPTGRWLLVAGSSHLELRDLTTLERVGADIPIDDGVFAVAIHPSGQWCALGRADGEIELLSLQSD